MSHENGPNVASTSSSRDSDGSNIKSNCSPAKKKKMFILSPVILKQLGKISQRKVNSKNSVRSSKPPLTPETETQKSDLIVTPETNIGDDSHTPLELEDEKLPGKDCSRGKEIDLGKSVESEENKSTAIEQKIKRDDHTELTLDRSKHVAENFVSVTENDSENPNESVKKVITEIEQKTEGDDHTELMLEPYQNLEKELVSAIEKDLVNSGESIKKISKEVQHKTGDNKHTDTQNENQSVSAIVNNSKQLNESENILSKEIQQRTKPDDNPIDMENVNEPLSVQENNVGQVHESEKNMGEEIQQKSKIHDDTDPESKPEKQHANKSLSGIEKTVDQSNECAQDTCDETQRPTEKDDRLQSELEQKNQCARESSSSIKNNVKKSDESGKKICPKQRRIENYFCIGSKMQHKESSVKDPPLVIGSNLEKTNASVQDISKEIRTKTDRSHSSSIENYLKIPDEPEKVTSTKIEQTAKDNCTKLERKHEEQPGVDSSSVRGIELIKSKKSVENVNNQRKNEKGDSHAIKSSVTRKVDRQTRISNSKIKVNGVQAKEISQSTTKARRKSYNDTSELQTNIADASSDDLKTTDVDSRHGKSSAISEVNNDDTKIIASTNLAVENEPADRDAIQSKEISKRNELPNKRKRSTPKNIRNLIKDPNLNPVEPSWNTAISDVALQYLNLNRSDGRNITNITNSLNDEKQTGPGIMLKSKAAKGADDKHKGQSTVRVKTSDPIPNAGDGSVKNHKKSSTPKRLGRPKGSKNKFKLTPESLEGENELKIKPKSMGGKRKFSHETETKSKNSIHSQEDSKPDTSPVRKSHGRFGRNSSQIIKLEESTIPSEAPGVQQHDLAVNDNTLENTEETMNNEIIDSKSNIFDNLMKNKCNIGTVSTIGAGDALDEVKGTISTRRSRKRNKSPVTPIHSLLSPLEKAPVESSAVAENEELPYNTRHKRSRRSVFDTNLVETPVVTRKSRTRRSNKSDEPISAEKRDDAKTELKTSADPVNGTLNESVDDPNKLDDISIDENNVTKDEQNPVDKATTNSVNRHQVKRAGAKQGKRKNQRNTRVGGDCNPATADGSRGNDNGVSEARDAESQPKVIMVKCAQCSEDVCDKDFANHSLWRHNNMAWRTTDPPLDFDNDPKLLNRLLVEAMKKKKKRLTCEKCSAPKRSVVGFISHIRFCGKTDEEKFALRVACPTCNSLLMPSSMEMHERMHKQANLESKNVVINEKDKPIETGSKRRAAQKAVEQISKFTALIRDEDEPSAKRTRPNSPSLNKFIEKPQLKKSIKGVLKTIWKKELTESGQTACRQPGCTMTFRSLSEIYNHYAACNFTPKKNFTCKVCKFTTENATEIADHVSEEHKSELSGPENSDFEESTYEEDDYVSDEEANKKKYESATMSEASKARKRIQWKMKFLSSSNMQHRRCNKPFRSALKWTLDHQLRNYELDLFPDLLPNTTHVLNPDASRVYFPQVDISMPTAKIDAKKYGNSAVQKTQWTRLKKFEGYIDNGVSTFFVGGPIWAMSWLPIPASLFGDQVDQYLAISAHPNMNREYSVGRSYTEKNIIQIWNMGHLSNASKQNSPRSPTLAYALAHENGTTWCLEWCPSGCYQEKNTSNSEVDAARKKNPKRMGLLACACSDGCVHIYSLPFPEEIESLRSENSRQLTYKTDPVATLVANSLIYESGNQNWQCTKLNWSREHGHGIIAAGFSNGYVALWNIANRSQLLSKKHGSTIIINAFQHFFAHGHAITAITLVPYGNERFLSTAAMDKYHKVWDLENVGVPLSSVKKGTVLDSTWTTHWPIAVNAYDNLGLNTTSTSLIPHREFAYPLRIAITSNSPIFTISVNDYANAIAQGSLAGEVQVIFPHQLLAPELDAVLAKRRQMKSFVEIVDLGDSQSPDYQKLFPSWKPKKAGSSKEYVYHPDTYDGCKNRFGMLFVDFDLTGRDQLPKQLQQRVTSTEKLLSIPLEAYPFASANKVTWNTNVWSHLWLATGYQCGIVRLSCCGSMHLPNAEDSLIPEHVNEMRAKEIQTTEETENESPRYDEDP